MIDHLRGTRAALALLALTALAASRVGAQAPAAPVTVRVENPLAIARSDETVSLAWSALQAKLPGLVATRVRVRDIGSGREISSQVIDTDANGTPDALLFQVDIRAKDARRYAIEPAAAGTFAPRTFVRHDEPRDDIAWESDRLAWRVYGEGLKKTTSAMSSSGVDIWVKKTRELVVQKWYDKGHDAYHVDTGEGADFYDVGTTLGAGGTAVWLNDSLYRADNFISWKVVAMGPIRTIVELEYPQWTAGALKVSQTKRISIDAGSNLYREESVFHSPGTTREIPYVIGELKRTGMVGTFSRTNAWAWLTGWGPTTPKQGGDGEIGTAVLLPRERVRDWKETPTHYLAVTSATVGVPVVHYVGAGWTLSGDFSDVRAWWRYLDEYALRLASPLTVTLGVP